MRKLLIVLASIGVLAVGPNGIGQCDDAAKNDFFNGKNTEGWEGLSQFWNVKDGAIIGSTYLKGINFNTFLCSKKKYKDFELQFQVRLKGEGWTGNSGVQIRSEVFDQKHLAVKGPQCDMGDVYWGSLYGEHFGGMMKAAPKDVVAKVLKKDDFNDYYIKCVDKHVTIKLNGETTIDDNFPKMPDNGIIAWQLHGGKAMEVTFKEIKFKELSR